jgi:hypothetical protein
MNAYLKEVADVCGTAATNFSVRADTLQLR